MRLNGPNLTTSTACWTTWPVMREQRPGSNAWCVGVMHCFTCQVIPLRRAVCNGALNKYAFWLCIGNKTAPREYDYLSMSHFFHFSSANSCQKNTPLGITRLGRECQKCRYGLRVHSLSPEGSGRNFENTIVNLILVIRIFTLSNDNAIS